MQKRKSNAGGVRSDGGVELPDIKEDEHRRKFLEFLGVKSADGGFQAVEGSGRRHHGLSLGLRTAVVAAGLTLALAVGIPSRASAESVKFNDSANSKIECTILSVNPREGMIFLDENGKSFIADTGDVKSVNGVSIKQFQHDFYSPDVRSGESAGEHFDRGSHLLNLFRQSYKHDLNALRVKLVRPSSNLRVDISEADAKLLDRSMMETWKSLDRDPSNVDAWLNNAEALHFMAMHLALTHKRHGDAGSILADKGLPCLDNALKLDPNNRKVKEIKPLMEQDVRRLRAYPHDRSQGTRGTIILERSPTSKVVGHLAAAKHISTEDVDSGKSILSMPEDFIKNNLILISSLLGSIGLGFGLRNIYRRRQIESVEDGLKRAYRYKAAAVGNQKPFWPHSDIKCERDVLLGWATKEFNKAFNNVEKTNDFALISRCGDIAEKELNDTNQAKRLWSRAVGGYSKKSDWDGVVGVGDRFEDVGDRATAKKLWSRAAGEGEKSNLSEHLRAAIDAYQKLGKPEKADNLYERYMNAVIREKEAE
ncbi:MAG: hypothetical protein V1921_02015 [Candidatus Altiarchaeota archaeon]